MTPSRAEACGCISPPDPVALGDDDFAVNQQAEQIIFEVEEDTVSAHVLIRYAGDPSQFAWIVPVPNAPELELSPAVTFALIDQATAPIVDIGIERLCPDPEYRCVHHEQPVCDAEKQDDGLFGGATAGGTSGGGNEGDTSPADDDDGEGPPGIDVIDMQQVGSYETVTFAAEDASLAVDWLRDNGFIVNDSMTPYMQPYIDGGMVFVAAKLIPDAGLDAIAPLKITYQGTQPMIPLRLTAVAAEPHLTVTAYIYGAGGYVPIDHPLAQIDQNRIIGDTAGRENYPMVLARTIDEAGGDAFVVEYDGSPPAAQFTDTSGCCGAADTCNLASDGDCQCPTSTFDRSDCEAIDGLLDAVDLLDRLQSYPRMTRLTTRLSPEEMTFDPVFDLGNTNAQSRLNLEGRELQLRGCENDIIDRDAYDAIVARRDCSAVYCGAGDCVVTERGPGCLCEAGMTAKQFTDLDGLPSITCVPEVGAVDLGLETALPDVCAGIDCELGSCVAVGGFPTCQCNAGAGAAFGDFTYAPCAATLATLGDSPGAENYTLAMEELEVCAPPPPRDCGQHGWLVENENAQLHGLECDSSIPDERAFIVPAKPTCSGEGCSCTAGRGSLGGMLMTLFGLALWRVRRRRSTT